MPVTLRPAHPDDIDAVLELWATSAENRSRPADTRAAVAAQLDRDPAALILATDRAGGAGPGVEQVVGSIIVGWDGWRCHVYRLAVRPERRRQGVGQALIAAAEQRARAVGATRIDAMVLADNDSGQAVWRATGFDQQADWRRWVKPLRDG
jgi:ribosomal protein S18 acetylase RimI-like enzyme